MPDRGEASSAVLAEQSYQVTRLGLLVVADAAFRPAEWVSAALGVPVMKLSILLNLCVCHRRLVSAGPTLSDAARRKAALLCQMDRAHIYLPIHVLLCARRGKSGSNRFLMVAWFALQVAALTVGQEHNRHFDQMFKVWVNMLVGIIPQNTDIGRAYEGATSAEDQDFVQNLALFLTAFFKVGALTSARHHPIFNPSDQDRPVYVGSLR